MSSDIQRQTHRDAKGRLWQVVVVPVERAEEEDARFWYEELSAEQRVVAVHECMKSALLAQGVEDDIVAIGKFKSQAARWLRRVNDTGRPLVITQNGTAAGVLMASGEFDRLRARLRLLEDIAAGSADFEQGRSLSTSQVRRELAKARRACK